MLCLDHTLFYQEIEEKKGSEPFDGMLTYIRHTKVQCFEKFLISVLVGYY